MKAEKQMCLMLLAIVRQGKENLAAPWLGITAFLMMTFLLSLLLFIGEGVRDAFDPHQGKSE